MQLPRLACAIWPSSNRYSRNLHPWCWGQPYLIIVIFFTLTQFLENKIYTEKTRKLRQNTQKIANFLRYYGKIHRKLPIFRVKSVKIYTSQKKFTRPPPVAPVTNMRYVPDIKLISGWSMVDIFYISSIQRLLAGGQVWPVSTSKEKSPDLSGQELVHSEKAPVRYHKHLFSTFLHLFINWRRKIKKMLPKALMTQALTALTSNVGLL